MRIIFVGRLIHGKGVQDLISVCNRLWDKFTFDLIIVGDGNFRLDLEDMVRLSYSSRVKFTGELSRPDVFAQLKQSDIFVNPSYSEGLPTSVLEAALVGLPIIATDVGGTREIIEDGTTGMLFKPHDVKHLNWNLSYLFEHPDIAKVLGLGAKQSVSVKFSWDTITKQYIDLLEEVVSEYTRDRLKRLHSTAVDQAATRRGA